MDIPRLCDRVIRYSFYLLFFLVPLILTPINYELFEFNKMIVTYALTTVIAGAWMIKSIATGTFSFRRTPADIPILLFISSQLISSFGSIDTHVSWFGYYSRFNGGMISILCYALLYWAFVSNFTSVSSIKYQVSSKKNEKIRPNISFMIHDPCNVIPFLKVALLSASLVALYGLLEHFGIDKHLWVQDVQSRVFSTLGQPNWLAAYIVALIPLTMALALHTQSPIHNLQSKKNAFLWILEIGYWILSILFFTVLLYTRSRSGLVAFTIVDVIFWVVIFLRFLRSHLASQDLQGETLQKPSYGAKSIVFPFLLSHISFFLVIFFNSTHIDSVDRWLTLESWKNRFQKSTTYNLQPPTTPSPSGTLLEYGGTESGTIRKYVWQGAITAWKSTTKTLLIGTGTETFAFAFYQFRPAGHNLTSEWDFLYNKAHNEYLNYLATTGILGLGSYIFLLLSFFYIMARVIRSQFTVHSNNSHTVNGKLFTIYLSLLLGWLSILITNFFGFSIVIMQLLLFLLPALAISLDTKSIHMYTTHTHLSKRSKHILIASSLCITLVIVFGIFIYWHADTLYAKGYRKNRSNDPQTASTFLKDAVSWFPAEPLYHDEYSLSLGTLAVATAEQNDATVSGQLFKESIRQNAVALATSPNNINFYKTRTKLLYAFSPYNPEFNTLAIDTLQKAHTLSPNDPKIIYNLAILYGREGNNDRAIELLKQSINLKPNYRDSYFALSVFYTETKKPEMAKDTLREYLKKVDPNDKEFLDKTK